MPRLFNSFYDAHSVITWFMQVRFPKIKGFIYILSNFFFKKCSYFYFALTELTAIGFLK